jgi:hypothetical protein
MSYQANTSNNWNGSGASSNLPTPPSASNAPSLTPSRPAPPIPRAIKSSQQAHPSSFAPSSNYNNSNGAFNHSSDHNNANLNFASSTSPSSSFSAGSGGGSAQTIVRRGWISVKEDGLRAWIWSKRWLVLREQTLSFYKSEVRFTVIVYLSTCLLTTTNLLGLRSPLQVRALFSCEI